MSFHVDCDYIFELINLVKSLKIEKVYLIDDNNVLEKESIKILDKKNYSIRKLNIDKTKRL